MNLTISQIKQTNYANKTILSRKNTNFNSLLENKKIDEEQDKLDYELYQKSVMLHSAFTYEEFKNHPDLFPPRNAPGIVRREWRNLCKNGTEEEQLQIMGLGLIFRDMLKKGKNTFNNNVNDYISLMSEVKKYIKFNYYSDIPGESNELYESLMNVTNKFETELKKYK